MLENRTADQMAASGSALYRKGLAVLETLEQSRLSHPRHPALTAPEWELLAAFDLCTLEAVNRRMQERALLAAYDGAPAALTEMVVEQSGTSLPEEDQAPCTDAKAVSCEETRLETSIVYEPDARRACLRYGVTWRSREQEAGGQPREFCNSRFYVVTFAVPSGGVMQREYGTIQHAPNQSRARNAVARELVSQPVMPPLGLH